jgi:16S rRNA (guanine527-N7)-methyltransferase
MDEAALQTLRGGAATLGVPLDALALERCSQLVAELLRWNRAYNLTAIDDPARIVTHHLLDSLSVHAALQGSRFADIGTGAGFPGLPLAIAAPQREFELIDSNNKKVRFVRHAAHALGLRNVTAHHVRVEDFVPAAPFDGVVSRAYSSLVAFVTSAAHLLGPGGRLYAMKGRRPDAELAELTAAGLVEREAPAGAVTDVGVASPAARGADGRAPWRLASVRPLDVPGLGEERHLVVLAGR